MFLYQLVWVNDSLNLYNGYSHLKYAWVPMQLATQVVAISFCLIKREKKIPISCIVRKQQQHLLTVCDFEGDLNCCAISVAMKI